MLATPRSPARDWWRRNFPVARRLQLLLRDRPATARVLELLWILFSTFACLYPPWTAHVPVGVSFGSRYGGQSFFLGYAPIWSSPATADDTFARFIVSFAAVDFSRLALEIVGAGLAFASLYIALGVRDQLRQTERTNAKSATSAQQGNQR